MFSTLDNGCLLVHNQYILVGATVSVAFLFFDFAFLSTPNWQSIILCPKTIKGFPLNSWRPTFTVALSCQNTHLALSMAFKIK